MILIVRFVLLTKKQKLSLFYYNELRYVVKPVFEYSMVVESHLEEHTQFS